MARTELATGSFPLQMAFSKTVQGWFLYTFPTIIVTLPHVLADFEGDFAEKNHRQRSNDAFDLTFCTHKLHSDVWQVFANRCNSAWATVLALLLAEAVVVSRAKSRTWGSICMATKNQGIWWYPWFCLLSSMVVSCCITCLCMPVLFPLPRLNTCLRGLLQCWVGWLNWIID